VKRSVLWRLLGLRAWLVAPTSSATISGDGVVSQAASCLSSTTALVSLQPSVLVSALSLPATNWDFVVGLSGFHVFFDRRNRITDHRARFEEPKMYVSFRAHIRWKVCF
jgi:hypothetical protein